MWHPGEVRGGGGDVLPRGQVQHGGGRPRAQPHPPRHPGHGQGLVSDVEWKMNCCHKESGQLSRPVKCHVFVMMLFNMFSFFLLLQLLYPMNENKLRVI